MLIILVHFLFGCSQKIPCLNVLIHGHFWSSVSCSKVRRIDLNTYIAFFIYGIFSLNNIKTVKQEEIVFLLFLMTKYGGVSLTGNYAKFLYMTMICQAART